MTEQQIEANLSSLAPENGSETVENLTNKHREHDSVKSNRQNDLTNLKFQVDLSSISPEIRLEKYLNLTNMILLSILSS